MSTSQAHLTVRKYEPHHQEWPYSKSDFRRDDERNDTSFYAQPRFLAHIDEAALQRLTAYYHDTVPLRGNVLDFCTSWRSWYAAAHEKAVANGELKVFGVGMSNAEMGANPLFNAFADRFRVLDLNSAGQDVDTLFGDTKFDCATCTVSIDYIVDAVDILSRVKNRMQKGGRVHLAISNRCFPTKAVRIWLGMSTEERLGLVCDYLHFTGWKDIEIVDLCARDESGERTTDDDGRVLPSKKLPQTATHLDPLWIVRAENK